MNKKRLVKRFLLERKHDWLDWAMSNRLMCSCDRGMVSVQVEYPTRDYPGWAEDRNCERCGGSGYFCAPSCKAKSRTKIAGWMFNGILKASHDMGTAVLSGWMKAQIRSMTWSCYSQSRVVEIAKETAAQLTIYERIIERRVDNWYKKENERIAKMYQEVGL